MFKFFENIVDPYGPYEEADTPPDRLWPFMKEYMRPFRKVLAVTALMSLLVASVEVWLIYYMGRVVDLLASDPSVFLEEHGTELLFVALFILLIRPALQALDVMFLNNGIMPNLGTLIRWRAHKHVLRQSVGWFENDFAGRIAN
ncbi:MAG: multidrug ABC transporter ATP-binding protein, partial [Pseudomonadota bacterium]